MQLIQSLGKREATSGIIFLNYLYQSPIITVKTVSEALNFTRNGAQKAIDRFIALKILEPYASGQKYGKRYVYKKYINIFDS